MRKIILGATLWASALLAACGGGGSDDAFQTPTTSPTPPAVSSVSVTSDRATILSDGSQTAAITAFVRDANNALMTNVPVTFSASSGGVSPASATTNAAGVATGVVVTAGDASLRTITITARAGNATGTTVSAATAWKAYNAADNILMNLDNSNVDLAQIVVKAIMVRLSQTTGALYGGLQN